MRSILAEEDSDYCGAFLPDGASTVSAVTGIVTGFADANLYLTTMPEAFAGPYPTASAPQLQRLGYRLEFQSRTSGPINAIMVDPQSGTLWGGSSNHGEDYGIGW